MKNLNEKNFWSLFESEQILKMKFEKMSEKYGYTMYPVQYALEVFIAS